MAPRLWQKRAALVATRAIRRGEEIYASYGEGYWRARGIDPATGLQPHHVRRIARVLGLEGTTAKQLPAFLASLYKAFGDLDASLIEINPLVVTGAGDLLALDAKMSFDDNALYRHKDVLELRDLTEEGVEPNPGPPRGVADSGDVPPRRSEGNHRATH